MSFGSFFFPSRRRHTRCALVTGVQTCALPILLGEAGLEPVDGGLAVAAVHPAQQAERPQVLGAQRLLLRDLGALDRSERQLGDVDEQGTVRIERAVLQRSEERRVGKECVSKCRTRWWRVNEQKKRNRST